MRQIFRLFVQKHDSGTYTVTLPGIQRVAFADWYDDESETVRLSAHGLMLEEVKDDLRQAMEKWLSKADPALLHRYSNFHEHQSLEKLEIELRPSDRHGKKRRDRVRIQFSLLVEKQEDGQYLVSVPKLLNPPLSFYCYALEELKETATRELAAYFSADSLEEMLEYRYQRQEFLDTLEVSFTPLKPQKEKKEKEEDSKEFWALKSAGVNLHARLKEGKLGRAYRRDSVVNEVLTTLAGDKGACVLLLGESGTGKTAVVHEAVRKIKEGNCPPALRNRQVWSTSPGQLIAGCCFIGSWEEKLKDLVEQVKRQRQILHVDDLPGLIEQGRWSKSDDNMALFLKPYVEDGTLVIVGECSPERFRVGENMDPGFLRLFKTVRLEETSPDDTLSVLTSVAGPLERRHNVRIEPGAAEAAVELTRRFQPYRSFPGKAVAFLERAASELGKPEGEERAIISRQAAVSAFARHTGLPEFIVSDHIRLDIGAVERFFAERIIGQPDGGKTVVDLITTVKAGLNDPHKPLGCYFFVGPTGVGKTEMAKTLAEFLFGSADRIIRFDMSEYAEHHTVSKLIGSAYTSEEGELTKRVRLQPFSVVLLDEFEKAHPSVFDVMLQALGEGRLTDAAGRTADFRSSVILMTSNLGASPREQRKTGLRAEERIRAAEAHFREQVESFFRPEFVNRLDNVVVFRSLDRDAMRQIASRELSKLLDREGIRRRGLLVEMDDSVVEMLLKTGFSPQYGARPLKREIERRIIVPLARYLVEKRVTGSQLVQVRLVEGEVKVVSSSMETTKKAVVRSASPLTAGNGREKLGLKQILEAFAAIRLRLQDWVESDSVREIENEYRRLLAKTRKRGFVAHGPAAHKVWSRIYHLERLTKRLNQLKDRAEYLEEFAAMAIRERYRKHESELANSFNELRRDSDYLEVELLCAHLPERGQALVRLRAIGAQKQDD